MFIQQESQLIIEKKRFSIAEVRWPNSDHHTREAVITIQLPNHIIERVSQTNGEKKKL